MNDEKQAKAMRAAIEALSSEDVYENGEKRRGISVRFLARLTQCRVAAGLLPTNHPLAVESKAMFENDVE